MPHRPALPLALGVIATGLAIVGAMAITDFAGRLAFLAVLAGLAALVGIAVLANWRMGLYIFLAWFVIEDLLRKFLGNDMRLFFAKDVLAGILYAAFLAARLRGAEPRPKMRFLVPLLLFTAWGLVQVFNPKSPSLIYGLLGLRMYFFYIPLFFIGYTFARDERDLRRFLAFNLAVAAVIAGLGIVQGIVGLDFLNPTVLAPELEPLGRLTRQAPISGALVPRPTSVFVSDGRFAWYMLVTFLLGVGTVPYLLARHARAWLAAAATGIIAAAIVVSGSRGTFMYALGSVGILAAAFVRGAGFRLRRRVRSMLSLWATTGALALVAVVSFFPEAVSARWSFYYETIAPWSPTSELAWRVWSYPIGEISKAFIIFPGWILGYGIGTSSLGVQYVTGLLGIPAPDIGVESGYGTLILELGILGPVLWLLWTLALVRDGLQVVRRLRDTPLFPVGFAFLWFALLLLFPLTFGGMQAYQNYIFNAYLWLLTGMLFRLPALAGPAGGR